MSNDDQQKTQAIPSLEDLLKADRKDMAHRNAPEEEDAAPTEAIDFNALMASGALPDLDMSTLKPNEPAAPPSPFGDMGDDMGMSSPQGSWGDEDKGADMSMGSPDMPPPMDDMDMSGPNMGGAGMDGPGMGGPSMGGGGGGGFSSPPPSAPEEGGKKNLYIALGVGAFLLFCCCPLASVGGWFGYSAYYVSSVSSEFNEYGDENTTVDTMGEEEGSDEGSTGDQEGAVASMTPDKLEEKVKALGWNVLGEPTRLNDKSITLPITKDGSGGAVSLNEFDLDVATDAFVDTMNKNEGAIVVRSGNKVVSVIMPGNKALAETLIKKILN